MVGRISSDSLELEGDYMIAVREFVRACRSTFVVGVFTIVLGLSAGCGAGDDGDGSDPTATPTSGPADTPTSLPTETEAPTQTPTVADTMTPNATPTATATATPTNQPAVLEFIEPVEGILLMAGTVAVQIALPPGAEDLMVDLDGGDVSDSFQVLADTASAGLAIFEEGEHRLDASIKLGVETATASVTFATVALDNPDECEVLNDEECFLPYPSSRFIVENPGGPGNGLRLALPQAGVPVLNGPQIPVEPYNQLDGFSPVATIITHFPQGIDLTQSDVARLLPPGEPGPPWIDTRTYDGRSLDPDSPTVILDAETGERVLHFAENDAHAKTIVNDNEVVDLQRQSFILRPARALEPGRRYIVAIRNVKDSAGDDVVAEAAFAALRDGRPTAIGAIEDRRQYMEDNVFAVLGDNGVAREDLVLAFDFVTQSEYQLTHQMLSMRDQAFAWLEQVEDDPEEITFTVTKVVDHDCGMPGQVVWRDVQGTYQSPLFLENDPDDAEAPTEPPAQFLHVDENDDPVQNGFMSSPFDISIPCSALAVDGPDLYPLVLGHGLFGTGESMALGIPPSAGAIVDEWSYIAGATLWRGLSAPDLGWVVNDVVGVGTNSIPNFQALPDRLRQGMLNTLVLAKMMKLGLFNRAAEFQAEGEGVFPGPDADAFYYGISLGGIMGTWFSALTPDVERFGVDVPSINFSCLLQRSTQFGRFQDLLRTSGLEDPMETLLGLQLTHELWVSGEPAGYAHRITENPFPGSGAPSKILMTPAWLDKQVSNQCTEIAARTLGLSNLAPGSILRGLQEIPDEEGPLESAYVMYDTGAFDLFNPDHQPFIPPLANLIPSGVCDPHGARPRIPASIRQLVNFLRPNGQVENFCDGDCDASESEEIGPGENPVPCDPLG
jgi:hypothetical protein